MVLPPLKPITGRTSYADCKPNNIPRKGGLPPLKPKSVDGGVQSTAARRHMEETVEKLLHDFKQGDKVKLTQPINPSGVFTLATEVLDHKVGRIVLIEWEDPIDHPSCNKRHAWARVENIAKVTP